MKKIKVTHCSNCPAGRGFYKSAGTGYRFTGYMCHVDPDNPICVIYTDLDPDEHPLPAECPLRDGDVVIGLG